MGGERIRRQEVSLRAVHCPGKAEGEPTLGGEHAMQHTDDVLETCTLKTYIILLTNATPTNAILKRDSIKQQKREERHKNKDI